MSYERTRIFTLEWRDRGFWIASSRYEDGLPREGSEDIPGATRWTIQEIADRRNAALGFVTKEREPIPYAEFIETLTHWRQEAPDKAGVVRNTLRGLEAALARYHQLRGEEAQP